MLQDLTLGGVGLQLDQALARPKRTLRTWGVLTGPDPSKPGALRQPGQVSPGLDWKMALHRAQRQPNLRLDTDRIVDLTCKALPVIES